MEPRSVSIFYEKNHMDMCLALAELLAKEALRNVLLFCGVLTAIVSMYMVLATAKKKQTADLLFGCRLDEQLQLGNARIAAMHDAQSPMKDLLLSCNEADRKEKGSGQVRAEPLGASGRWYCSRDLPRGNAAPVQPFKCREPVQESQALYRRGALQGAEGHVLQTF